MHLLFIDESGTPPKPGKDHPHYFVVGGIIIPETSWFRMRDGLDGLKARRKLRGEIKWRYFAPSNDDPRNPMRALPQAERDKVREEIYKLISSETAVKTMACVASVKAAYAMDSITGPDDIYHATYKPITERFEYYLTGFSKITGRKETGLIIGDHRGQQDDKRLRGHHQKLLHAKSPVITKYKNLVEGLLLQPSHLSIGIQLADMVAGAVWRKFERNDEKYYDLLKPSLRKDSSGNEAGHGIVKMPKAGWT